MLTTSPEIAEFAAAFAAAQAKFPPLVTDAEAQIKNERASYQYKYATLAQIFKNYLPLLAGEGIFFTQSPGEFREGRIYVTTFLMHKSGQWLRNEVSLPAVPATTPQTFGSLLSFLRRYAALATLGIAAEDDDGAAAEAAAKSAPREQPPTPHREQTPPPPAEAPSLPPNAPPLPNAFEEKKRFLNRLRENFADYELTRKEEGEIALSILRDVPEKWTAEVWAKCADAPHADFVEAVNRTLIARAVPEEAAV